MSIVAKITDGVREASFRALDRVIALTADDDQPWFDPSRWSWTKEFEKRHDFIKREAEAVVSDYARLPNMQDLDDAKRKRTVNRDDKWKPFVFYAYGSRIEKNCEKCPATYDALKTVPGLQNALFSILQPNKHIAPHTGKYKGALRYHLGVIVPHPEKCRIRVGRDVKHWSEGSSFVFDHTFDHEAWNDSPEIRVILLLDFLRDLPPVVATFNDLAFWTLNKSQHVKQVRQHAEDDHVRAPGD